jgi:hypothetical protein
VKAKTWWQCVLFVFEGSYIYIYIYIVIVRSLKCVPEIVHMLFYELCLFKIFLWSGGRIKVTNRIFSSQLK